MLKKVLLLGFSLGVLSFTHAQRGLDIGVVAAPQLTHMLDPTWQDDGKARQYNLSYGYQFGAQVALNLSDRFGIGAGLLSSQQGVSFTTANDWFLVLDSSTGAGYMPPQRKFGYRMSYYKVPVFLKLNTSLQAKTSFMILLGPQLSFLQKAQEYDEGLENNGIQVLPKIDRDAKADFTDTELSFMLALDGRHNISKNVYISTLIRADYSLNSIAHPDQLPGRNIRNLTLGFQVGLHFVLAL